MAERANHRQQEILDALRRAGGSLRVNAIARELEVSEETVRRNIRHLSDQGIVEKVHGGARLAAPEAETAFHDRLRENPDAKRRIARHVAAMIPDGASLFLDVGSTTSFIADALRDHAQLLIVTNSVSVAYKLSTRNENRVFMAGGELRGHDGGAFGVDAMAFAESFRTDFAILSAVGITAQAGFMLFDLAEARFSRLIMRQARTRIIAADASKFGRVAPITITDPAAVDYLVCDAPPPDDIAAAAQGWGTRIEVAGA
ncbi:MAG: DeoR/GlpR transcriptional regulator [Rhodobacteraceae bacterium]|nr:DeoR/GlpR transcriptional regulator [Paracoccaceae bacterium]